jgi:iron(III) transport system substrate-binding protein
MRLRALAAASALAATIGCRIEVGAPQGVAAAQQATTVHVYTSMYKHVVDAVGPALAAELARTSPGTTVDWFQSGSEKVAQRLDAELSAGGSPCDVLLTSDPTHYARLKREGLLAPYVSPRALRQPRELIDPDGAWAASRFSLMVLAVAPTVAASARAPSSFRDLGALERVALGDPLSSGTNLFTVSTLAARLGWSWFEQLKSRGAVVAGGNASVLQRIESGESDAGWVLFENVAAARSKGERVALVVPADGGVLVPGPIALLPHARHSEQARAVYDALLSESVQRVIVDVGRLHSPDLSLPPPDGAPPLRELLARATPPSSESPEQIKAKFSAIFFRQ